MILAPGTKTTSPLGRPIRLMRQMEEHGHWVCIYLDSPNREEVQLSVATILMGLKRQRGEK